MKKLHQDQPLLLLNKTKRIGKRKLELVRCHCGNEKYVDIANIKRGQKSCGCSQGKNIGLAKTTHGMTRTPEWNTWTSMKARCKNSKLQNYKYYGGKGITVCKRWEKFENFIEDMGTKPSPEYSIERKDPNGNYEPNNCIWADRLTQSRNRTSAIIIDGMTLKEWCAKNNQSYKYIHKVYREVNKKY